MRKVIVAVGSVRQPKLNAVWEALTIFGPILDPNAPFEVVGEAVGSGVRHTPLSREEIMAGARHRAEALARRAKQGTLPWNYFVGLEGGVEVCEREGARLVFLENWAYVADTSGKGAYGQSGGILLPAELAGRVVEEGHELGVVIDSFAGGKAIRDAQGAWGVLTGNLITRQDAFRTAVINAFAPFYNPGVYSSSRAARWQR